MQIDTLVIESKSAKLFTSVYPNKSAKLPSRCGANIKLLLLISGVLVAPP
jgi:hypothetical protein